MILQSPSGVRMVVCFILLSILTNIVEGVPTNGENWKDEVTTVVKELEELSVKSLWLKRSREREVNIYHNSGYLKRKCYRGRKQVK